MTAEEIQTSLVAERFEAMLMKTAAFKSVMLRPDFDIEKQVHRSDKRGDIRNVFASKVARLNAVPAGGMK